MVRFNINMLLLLSFYKLITTAHCPLPTDY